MANLVLFKTSEQIYSHIHGDFLDEYWQIEIPIKLLSFFAHSLYIKNFEFLQHFNDKFLLVIEAWAGKKNNWNKIAIIGTSVIIAAGSVGAAAVPAAALLTISTIILYSAWIYTPSSQYSGGA